MGITLQIIFSTTQEECLETVMDAELYATYSDELQSLHEISLQPNDTVVDSLMAKINFLTFQNKSCVS